MRSINYSLRVLALFAATMLVPMGLFAQSGPGISTQPSSQTTIAGSNVTFTVVGTGQTPLTYQWSNNGTDLSDNAHIIGSTNSTLTIVSVQTNDAGSYRVVVSNRHGSVTSSNATLTVLVPPTITQQPSNTIIAAGSNAYFSATTSGTSPMTNRWLFNGVALIDGGRVSGATSTSLTIANITGADAGSYSLAVSNAAGSTTSSAATLTTVFPPVISTIANQKMFPLGTRTASFTVGDPQASALSLSATVQFDNVIPPQNILFGGSGSNRTVTVTATETTGRPTITVTVSNAYGLTASTSFTVSVVDFTELPAGLTNMANGVVKWVDYDNDGRLDLFISGEDTSYVARTQLYHNEGNGQFRLVPTPFPNLNYSSADWADFDNDGLADLVLAGVINNQTPVAQVYRNLGNGQFSLVATLPSSLDPHVAWGDYNNDGKPDIAVLGSASYIYRNNGDGTFTQAVTGLPGGSFGSVTWADYNNDGWLDLLVIGGNTTYLYRNNRDGSFNNSGISLPGLQSPGVAWGDFNGDGQIDLLLSGSSSGTQIARVYVNSGGTLTDLGLTIPQLAKSAAAWGDFDNDGKLDLLLTGDDFNTRPAFLYRNGGGNTLTDSRIHVLGGYYGSVAWGDFDNDGGLDFVVMGFAGTGSIPTTRLYHNDGALPNTPPTAPDGLTAIVSNNAVILSWNAATDAEQTIGLSYNLRVGSTPGAINVLAPMADLSTGQRRVAQIGNAGYRLTQTITNLANGTYYWSVQSIDNAFAGSSFAGEQSFQITAFPTITAQPQSQTVQVYSPLSLSVAGTGSSPLTYQWYQGAVALSDNTQITGTQTATLSIASADWSTPGDYTAVLSNAFGAVTSTVATVTVIGPPVFSTPTSQTVGVGTNISPFTIIIGGSQPLTNQWFFNGAPVVTNDRVFILENTSSNSMFSALYINNAQASDAGSYWLVSSNVAGSATSATATLTIGFPPVVTQPPSPATNILNTSATFTVSAAGSDPLTYQWFFGATKLTDDGRIVGSTTSSLTLTNVSNTDAGTFSVVISNAFGATTNSDASLTVLVPPIMTSQPFGRSVPLGLPTVFSGSSMGTTPFSYQWQLNGANIPGATTTAYTVSAMSAADVGSYTLVVTNVAGITTSATAVLTVGPVAGWGYNLYNQCMPPPGLSNVVTPIANYSSVAVLADGSVTKWGNIGSVSVSGLSNIVAVALNNVVSTGPQGVALGSDGTIIGIGTTLKPTYTNMTAVAIGSGSSPFVYGLRSDGTVLGTDQRVPVGLTKVTAISVSGSQGMALRSDGTVVVWAINSTATAATNVPAGLSNVVSIASGNGYCLAAKSDGHVVAWQNYYLVAAVTNVPASATNVIAVATGTYSQQALPISIALRADGTVVTWGSTSFNPTNIINPSSITNAVAVSAGNSYGLALINDGSPQILRSPLGGTAFTGRDFMLSVQAAGAPQLAYQWTFNGTNIDGATNASLLITNIQSDNAGTYQVTVTNGLGAVSSLPVPVAVMDHAPFFNTQPASRVVYVGNSVNLGVPVSGSGPISYQWRFGTNPAAQIWQDIPGATNEDLIFNPVQATDSAYYSLVASNAFGSVTSSTAILTVRQVVAWGDSTYGKTNVPSTLTNAIAVCGGDYYNSLALRADGTVSSWGTTISNYSTVPNVTEIAAPSGSGGGAYIALRRDGSVTTLTGPTTLRTALNSLSNIVAIESDSLGTSCLRADGSIARFNTSGTPITTAFSNFVALTSFDDGYIAVHPDGSLYYTGGGNAPNVKTVTNVQAIAAARYQGTVLNRNGTVQSWGVTTNAPAGSNFISVAASSLTSAAVDANGNVLIWSGSSNDLSLTNAPSGLSKVWSLDGGYRGFVALCTTNTFPPLPLSKSLDTSNLVVSSRNSAQWYGQTNVSKYGGSAAQSAQIGSNTSSSMRTLCTNGPIVVAFWWKVSSLTNHSLLTFSIGGVQQASISGEVGWQHVAFTVPAGPQMLVWTYSKDGAGSAGLDAGFVDQLFFDPIAPTILSQPSSQTILGGPLITFTASATGTAPLNYRWFNRVSGTPVATGSSFTISPTTRSSSGTYYVMVTNSAGPVRGSNFVLTVHVPELIGVPQLQTDGTFTIGTQDADQTQFNGNTDLSGLQVQYSSNLIDWWPVLSPLTISNGAASFNDTDSTNAPTRFYRIVEPW